MGQIHANAWLVASVDRMVKADLRALVQSLPGEFAPYPRGALKTCDAMRAYIILARRYFYQDRLLKRQISDLLEKSKPAPRRPTAVRRESGQSLCKISAAEVNEFLRQISQ